MADLRFISLADLSGPLEVVAQFDVSDAELRPYGIELTEQDRWDGLGAYAGRYVELRTGEQCLLRRFDGSPVQGLDVLGLIERDAPEQTARLAAALDVPPERMTWQVPADAWRELQDTLKRHRRENP